SLEGFVIAHLPEPALGLSVHRLAALQAVLMIALGTAWPKLRLGPGMARVAFWLLVYSGIAILCAYGVAALAGAGGETLALAAGSARGSAFQEPAIKLLAYSSAPTGIVSFALILWGLRITA